MNKEVQMVIRTKDILLGIVITTEYPLSVVFSISSMGKK